MTTFIAKEGAAQRSEVHELLVTSRIVAPVSGAYPLERAADALRDLEDGRISGKAVILVGAVS